MGYGMSFNKDALKDGMTLVMHSKDFNEGQVHLRTRRELLMVINALTELLHDTGETGEI